jgi:predicted Zn-dependent protease
MKIWIAALTALLSTGVPVANAAAPDAAQLLGTFKAESLEEELDFGRLTIAQILGAVKLVGDARLQEYVNLVGRNLASQTNRPDLPWTFAVLDTRFVNAFAAPGGYILITRGLFDSLETEDELAAVLGHEIVHVLRKHHFEVMRQQKLVEFGAEAVSQGSSGDTSALAHMTGAVLARGLDKGAEFEADREGVLLARRAGYSGQAMLGVLERLDARSREDAASFELLLATHPTPAQRRTELLRASGGKPTQDPLSPAARRLATYRSK